MFVFVYVCVFLLGTRSLEGVSGSALIFFRLCCSVLPCKRYSVSTGATPEVVEPAPPCIKHDWPARVQQLPATPMWLLARCALSLGSACCRCSVGCRRTGVAPGSVGAVGQSASGRTYANCGQGDGSGGAAGAARARGKAGAATAAATARSTWQQEWRALEDHWQTGD